MEIKLNPNGWHKRLQEYVFLDDPPDFQNFCPYFWITIFCIFAAPFVMIVKRLHHIGTSTTAFIDKRMVMPLVMAKLRQVSKEDLFIGYCLVYRDSSIVQNKRERKRLTRLFDQYSETIDNWLLTLNEYITPEYSLTAKGAQKIRELNVLELAARGRNDITTAERRQRYLTIIKYTKWIGKSVLILLGCVALYYLGVLAFWLWNNYYFDLQLFLKVLTIVASIIVMCFVAIVLGFGFVKLVGGGEAIADASLRFFTRIGKVFSFFGMYIVAIKKDYCPHIIWTDEA